MAQLKWKLSALFIKDEASFGVDPDATGAGYKHLKSAFDMAFTPAQDVHEQSGLTNSMTRQAHVMGTKSGSLTFKLDLKGSGTVTTDEVSAVKAEADMVLFALFGNRTHGVGSKTHAATPCTTTVLNVEAGDGAGYAVGMMVNVDCGATYGMVPRFVESIATDAITLDRALPAAPGLGVAVHASTLYKKANTGHVSLAFVATKDTVQYTLLGCKLDSVKISGAQSGAISVLEITVSVSDWSKTAKASLPATILSGITAVKAPIVKASCLAWGDTEYHVNALDLVFNHKFEFVDSTCALGPAVPDSQHAGLELVDAAPQGTIHPYYNDQFMTDFSAGTEKSLAFAVPSQPGATGANGWGVFIPKAQLGQPAFEDHNGMVGQTMPFMVNDNGTASELYLSVA